jgi:hypothetical protein
MVKEDVETDTVFLSTKISKIRWLPTPLLPCDGGFGGVVAVGSYDEIV